MSLFLVLVLLLPLVLALHLLLLRVRNRSAVLLLEAVTLRVVGILRQNPIILRRVTLLHEHRIPNRSRTVIRADVRHDPSPVNKHIQESLDTLVEPVSVNNIHTL
jgi:hypothetical protein